MNSFKFNIITSTKKFKKLKDFAIKNDLVRDLCRPEYNELDGDTLTPDQYIHIVQKSDLWLKLRAQADSTASSLGKKIPGPHRFPTQKNIEECWFDDVTKKPFEKTHTMRGHMSWGVGYEDPALLHFAKYTGLGVMQVGCVRVDFGFIKGLIGEYCPDISLSDIQDIPDQSYLLISPDGIVGVPDYARRGQDGIGTEAYRHIVGMLEIKCISPFHHIETSDGFLTWVASMEQRQWYDVDQVPFVYVVQMGLQALSGRLFYNMNDNHQMWFIRWSPDGFSLFQFEFLDLTRLGIVASLLYMCLKKRTKTEIDVSNVFPLTERESALYNELLKIYRQLRANSVHHHQEIDDYPEFNLYREITSESKFVVPEIDPETLQVHFDKQKSAVDVVTANDIESETEKSISKTNDDASKPKIKKRPDKKIIVNKSNKESSTKSIKEESSKSKGESSYQSKKSTSSKKTTKSWRREPYGALDVSECLI